jgi:hypothetical protein
MGAVHNITVKGFPVDQWKRAGLVLLVIGLVLLALSFDGMDRDVVARSAVWTNLEYQTTAPLDLPGGPISIWLEDHPSWPGETWDIEVALNQSGTWFWSTIPGDFHYQDIEGVRCFMIGTFWSSPSGQVQIDVELWDWSDDPLEEVAIFVLTSPGPTVVELLVVGMITAVLGAVIAAARKWPMRGQEVE